MKSVTFRHVESKVFVDVSDFKCIKTTQRYCISIQFNIVIRATFKTKR